MADRTRDTQRVFGAPYVESAHVVIVDPMGAKYHLILRPETEDGGKVVRPVEVVVALIRKFAQRYEIPASEVSDG